MNWVEAQRRDQRMAVSAIGFDEATPWEFRQGAIERPDGRFFRLRSRDQRVWIDQPEVGLLGFIIHTDPVGEIEILCHAKAEPGNAPLVQLAPTVQATESNFQRVHGGLSTPFLEFFDSKTATGSLLSASLQSEQGTKFWRKRNRNALVDVAVGEAGPQHRWWPVSDFLPLLALSGMVNTDARSVLATAYWPHLVKPGLRPFARSPEHLRPVLNLLPNQSSLDFARQVLRHHTPQVAQFPDSAWDPTGQVLSDFAHGVDLPGVIAVEVTTDSREVTHWAQPLIRQSQPEVHTLAAQLREGRLHFLLRATTESGLYNGCEYSTTLSSASVTSEIGNAGVVAANINDICLNSEVLLEIEQSDEGGRFFQVLGQYRVVLASENSRWPEDSVLADSGYAWVGLWELMELCRTTGSTTNELRSATSMLLSWL